MWELQSDTTTPYTYVRTHTDYNGTTSHPAWGQATQVTEDVGGIQRITQTHDYTTWGKACDVIDAAGHEFVTSYDPDGNVLSVTETDGGQSQALATYTYGNSGVENGRVKTVIDGLSGITDSFSYTGSGGGIGQVAGTAENGGGNPSYTVGYTYNVAGDRDTSTYVTTNGTTRWKYTDYLNVGEPTSPKRVFQTMAQLDGSGNRTAEEFHYAYDSAGRVVGAAFAQTPQAGSPTANGYYDSQLAASRATAYYAYDPSGRVQTVQHYWETLVNGAYTQQAIIGNSCSYELGTGLNRGLKLGETTYLGTAGAGPSWTASHSATYGYDANFDYLTSASYTDGLPNASQSWTYDAAGNRNDSVCDNLNRPTSINGYAIDSDILGNRVTQQVDGAQRSYTWDALNRMTGIWRRSVMAGGRMGPSIAIQKNTYRADGMRTFKDDAVLMLGSSRNDGTIYRYDGQMGIEDDTFDGTDTTVTDYALGARGVDGMSVSKNGGSAVLSYPLYDAHGNMVMTISRAGTNNFSPSSERSFDAWGNMRMGTAGDPSGRYCANLGHKQDDESGLVYMRARYYEPTSGRFISQDPGKHGMNWYVYCSNDPANKSDQSGRDESYATPGKMAEFFKDVIDQANEEVDYAGDIEQLKPGVEKTLRALYRQIMARIKHASTRAAQDELAGAMVEEGGAIGGPIGAEISQDLGEMEQGKGILTWADAVADGGQALQNLQMIAQLGGYDLGI